MSSLSIRSDTLILDACCVINLHVSGQMKEILQAAGVRLAVAQEVKKNEVLFADDPGEAGEKQPVDLDSLAHEGVLEVVDFETEEEADMIVNLAALRLDMGESVTVAIAVYRHWALATDERKCLGIMRELFPKIQVVTTPDLVRLWVDKTNPPAAVLQSVLRAIAQKGHYAPPKSHALYEWWMTCSGSPG